LERGKHKGPGDLPGPSVAPPGIEPGLS
jgi:hypothetical protein